MFSEVTPLPKAASMYPCGYHASQPRKVPAGDLLRGTAEENVQAAGTYVSYCGQYEFRGDTVVHRVELSLFPNWVGSDQERLRELRGNRLRFSTRPVLLGGVQQTAHLIWERV